MIKRPILVTPFNGQTLKTTGSSTDSGFDDIAAIVKAMGTDYIACSKRLVIYGDDVNRVVFSDLDFHID